MKDAQAKLDAQKKADANKNNGQSANTGTITTGGTITPTTLKTSEQATLNASLNADKLATTGVDATMIVLTGVMLAIGAAAAWEASRRNCVSTLRHAYRC